MQGQLAPLTTVYISHMHLQLQRATTTTTTRSIAYHTVYTCVQQQCCTLVSLQLSLTSRDTRSIRAMHACLQIKIAKERMDLARLTLCCALILIPSEQCPPPPPLPLRELHYFSIAQQRWIARWRRFSNSPLSRKHCFFTLGWRSIIQKGKKILFRSLCRLINKLNIIYR